MNTQAVLEEAKRILLENQIECVRLVSAYQLHTPIEKPSRAWQEARYSYEQRQGVRLVKFFSAQGE